MSIPRKRGSSPLMKLVEVHKILDGDDAQHHLKAEETHGVAGHAFDGGDDHEAHAEPRHNDDLENDKDAVDDEEAAGHELRAPTATRKRD